MSSRNEDFCGWVIGIVDAYGAVHSKECPCIGGSNPTHKDYWPTALKLWRWSPATGFDDCLGARKEDLTLEDWSAVRNELERMGFDPDGGGL